MAVYTDIADEELAALLECYELGEATALKGIAEGVSNSNFLLETTTGRFILTIYESRVDQADLPYFLGLMGYLARHGFPSAAPIATRSGDTLAQVQGKPCAIVPFLPGISVKRPTIAHCHEAGGGLARLHLAAAEFPGRRANDLGHDRWGTMFAPLHVAADGLKPGLTTTILGDLAAFADQWPTGLPRGPIHADYFPDNVFFRDGRFAAAIDFYFACDDDLAYDLAIALNAWCFEADGSFNITAAHAMIAGYDAIRTLSRAEHGALPMLAWGAAMRFFLTRLQDWGKASPGALVKPHNPLEFERKLAVHRAGLHL